MPMRTNYLFQTPPSLNQKFMKSALLQIVCDLVFFYNFYCHLEASVLLFVLIIVARDL